MSRWRFHNLVLIIFPTKPAVLVVLLSPHSSNAGRFARPLPPHAPAALLPPFPPHHCPPPPPPPPPCFRPAAPRRCLVSLRPPPAEEHEDSVFWRRPPNAQRPLSFRMCPS